MSWYVAGDGRQVWVERDDVVYVVEKPADELPMEILTYLAVNSNKAIYAEHMVDEESGKRGKAKEKQGGRQRGFVVRVDKAEEGTKCVVPVFRRAAERLMESGVVSRVDVDDSAEKAEKKRKNRRKGGGSGGAGAAGEEKEEEKKAEEPAPAPAVPMLPVGVNECRVETTSRCLHNAHGSGFRVEVMDSDGQQRIHFYTACKDMDKSAWHRSLVEAVVSSGSRVMLGRLAGNGTGEDAKVKATRDDARDDEDEWLGALMGRCMVGKDVQKGKSTDLATLEAAADAGEDSTPRNSKAEDADAIAKAQAKLPPWLRRKK